MDAALVYTVRLACRPTRPSRGRERSQPDMDPHNLVAMANRIAAFFEVMPDRAEALDGVFQHLRKFWEPRMRQQLLQHAHAHAGADLHPLVAEVVAARGDELRPPGRSAGA